MRDEALFTMGVIFIVTLITVVTLFNLSHEQNMAKNGLEECIIRDGGAVHTIWVKDCGTLVKVYEGKIK